MRRSEERFRYEHHFKVFTRRQPSWLCGRAFSPTNVELLALCICVTLAVTNSRVSHWCAGPLTVLPAEASAPRWITASRVLASCLDFNERRRWTCWKQRKCTFPYHWPDSVVDGFVETTAWSLPEVLSCAGKNARFYLPKEPCTPQSDCWGVFLATFNDSNAAQLRSSVWMLCHVVETVFRTFCR